MPFWGLFGKAVTGPMKDVSGTAKDVSEITKDVTGIRKDIVDTKLAEKNLADPTLEDVLRYDRNLQRFKTEWEADKARQANGSDTESWLSTRWVGPITSLFVLIVLFLCLWYLIKTVLHLE